MNPILDCEKVDCNVISEDIKFGERIRRYRLQGLLNNQWETISVGESVGQKRIETFPAKAFSKFKLLITDYFGTPVIKTFECYSRGDQIEK